MYAFEVLGGLSSSSAGFPSLEGHSHILFEYPRVSCKGACRKLLSGFVLPFYSCFRFCVCVRACARVCQSIQAVPFYYFFYFYFFAGIAFILYLPSKKTHSFILVQTLCSYYLSLYNMSHIVETLRLVMFSFIG